MFKLLPLDSKEAIENFGKDVGNILDFWGWAYSALFVPIPRGFFAEYIVFKSIKDKQDKEFRLPLNYLSTKLEKEEPDLITFLGNSKMTIQVKSIDSLKSEPSFKFNKTHKFNRASDKDDGNKEHCSDLFVFCYLSLNEKQHKRIDDLRREGCKNEEEEKEYSTLQDNLNRSVLDMGNWTFYVCPVEIVKKQNSIRLSKLEKYSDNAKVRKCSYSNLHLSIKEYHGIKRAGRNVF